MWSIQINFAMEFINFVTLVYLNTQFCQLAAIVLYLYYLQCQALIMSRSAQCQIIRP